MPGSHAVLVPTLILYMHMQDSDGASKHIIASLCKLNAAELPAVNLALIDSTLAV